MTLTFFSNLQLPSGVTPGSCGLRNTSIYGSPTVHTVSSRNRVASYRAVRLGLRGLSAMSETWRVRWKDFHVGCVTCSSSEPSFFSNLQLPSGVTPGSCGLRNESIYGTWFFPDTAHSGLTQQGCVLQSTRPAWIICNVRNLNSKMKGLSCWMCHVSINWTFFFQSW